MKRKQDTRRQRRQKVLALIEEFRDGKKRTCLDDEEVISWLEEGSELEDLFGGEEGQIDYSVFHHWLETSVYRAITKGAIEIFKRDGIFHPSVLDTRFAEILAHCEAFEFKLEELGINQTELKKLLEKKIVEWSQLEFERYQRETTRLKKDWQKVVEILLERNLVAPVLGKKFAPVSLPKSKKE